MERAKPFKTIDEQLDLLESRGLRILNREAAALYFLSNNYYSVVNGYKEILLDPDRCSQHSERYFKGACLEHIKLLHSFDTWLRMVTLNAILDVEERMKTAMVYAFCERHPEPEAYLDPSSYVSRDTYEASHKSGTYTKNLIKLLSTLQSVHDGRTRSSSIAHYRNDYGFVPLWVLARSLTFGNMSAFFDLQATGIQNSTAKILARTAQRERITPKQVQQAYRVLVPFRNICAHGEPVYCAKVGLRGTYGYIDLMQALASMLSFSEYYERVVDRVSECFDTFMDEPHLQEIVLQRMGLRETDLIPPYYLQAYYASKQPTPVA